MMLTCYYCISCSGFFAFKREALRSLELESDDFDIHLEIFAQMERRGFKIREVPAKFIHKTESGEASISQHAPKMILGALKLWFRLKKTASNAN